MNRQQGRLLRNCSEISIGRKYRQPVMLNPHEANFKKIKPTAFNQMLTESEEQTFWSFGELQREWTRRNICWSHYGAPDSQTVCP
jgi:hypothetical protein